MGIMPTIFLSVKSAVMWIERLLYGVLRVLTPLGPRYLGPSFLERAYLLWTFRNFTSLPWQWSIIGSRNWWTGFTHSRNLYPWLSKTVCLTSR